MAFPLKKLLQALAQRLLGFERYLVWFSAFKVLTLRWDRPDQEGDFNRFLDLLAPGDVVLDIGANIGIMSVLLARRCQPGQVHAFEPIPENVQALKRVVKLFGLPNVTVYEVALGAQEGRVEMHMPVQQGVRMQGLAHVNHDSIAGYADAHHTYEVAVHTLDHMDQMLNLDVAAIKMDVENFEQFVLRGGISLLRRRQPVIFCELWDNDNRKACMELLGELGYTPMVWRNNLLKAFEAGKDPNHNFLFIPSSPAEGGPVRWASLHPVH